MIRAFRISYALKNTYRVNSIIYAIQQIPLLRRILPDTLYGNQGLKILANVISAIWELLSMFLGKVLYLILMVGMAAGFYGEGDMAGHGLHILLFLTIIGAVLNTYMFNPTNDKYYAMILMRMDARQYTLSNYLYAMIKGIVGFLPFTIIMGLSWGLSLGMCILLPFFIMGIKMIAAWLFLLRYEKKGVCMNENLPPKFAWPLTGILLLLAYGLPYLGILVPASVIAGLAVLVVLAGVYSLVKILRFKEYRPMYQMILADKRNAMYLVANPQQMVQNQSRKMITMEEGFTSRKTGFEYFNEIFIRRHKRILWRPAKQVAAIAAAIVAVLLFMVIGNDSVKPAVNRLMLIYLPYFVFIMYAINRGTSFTQVLFMNCDHGMLTYAFYKKPEFILKLFRIRLREIIKVNLLPAAVIGGGLAALLYCSGGSDNPLNYVVLAVSILIMSVFFSVHYLTCYYLLQPYNVNTEMKSGVYRLVMTATYIVCFFFMKLRMSTLIFGVVVTLFCILYSVIACILVYRLAPKTFRLRN